MFKYLVAAYWIFGCAVVGLAHGSLHNDCPNSKQEIERAVEIAATWPIYFVAALVIKEPTKIKCNSITSSRFDPV